MESSPLEKNHNSVPFKFIFILFCFSPWFESDVDGGVEDTDDGKGEEVVRGARHDRVVPAGLRKQVNLAIEIPFQHVGEVPEAYLKLIDW